MNGRDLVAQANRLARATSRRPRQVDLNRAVSSAYYGLFHTLAKLAADTIVGVGADRSTAAWRQTYRALNHGLAKNACKQAQSRGFPACIVQFAEAFVDLQELRHSADYDPTAIFKRADVVASIDLAEQAIFNLGMASRRDLRAFVALVMLQERR